MATLALAACATPPPPGPVVPRGPSGGVFVTPMGEPLRGSGDLVGTWFAAVDADRDGALTVAEMQADAARFFRTLDTNGDSEITPPEMVRYEREVAPEVQLGMGRRRAGDPDERREGREFGLEDGQRREREGRLRERLAEGATRYALLDLPQPVAAADTDYNRAVTAQEFAEAAATRFAQLDRDRDGRISRAELDPVPLAVPAN